MSRYIDKVEAGSAAKSLGLAPNDVIVDMNNITADQLEKWGVKSSKMMKHLIERPLDVNVARGLPLHQLLLPARIDNDPDKEKKIKKRIKQGKSKRAVADSNQRSAAREDMRRPSMFATDAMHSLQEQNSGLGSHDLGGDGGGGSGDDGGGYGSSADDGGYGSGTGGTGGGNNSRGTMGSMDQAAASVRSRKNRGSVWGAARASMAMGVFHTPSGGDVTGSGGGNGNGNRRAGRGSIFDSMNTGNNDYDDGDSSDDGEEEGVSTKPKKGGWAKLRAAHTLNVGAKAALKANHSAASFDDR